MTTRIHTKSRKRTRSHGIYYVALLAVILIAVALREHYAQATAPTGTVSASTGAHHQPIGGATSADNDTVDTDAADTESRLGPRGDDGTFTRAQLAAYAASLDNLTKEDLKTAASLIMHPQQVLRYGPGQGATWWGFWYTDRVDTRTNECFNRYSDRKFYFSGHDGQRIDGMNIEHSFPKSWWGGDKGVAAYMDLYNLYPSDAEANSDKSNYAMGVVNVVNSSGGAGYDKVGRGTIDGQQTMLWEPGDLFKGEFARSYMYMATTYQHYTWVGTRALQELQTGTWPTLRPWAYRLYLQWNASDEVDLVEVHRNQAVYELQGNRNLFIDYPNLCQYIWGDSIGTPFHPASSVTTARDDDRY